VLQRLKLHLVYIHAKLASFQLTLSSVGHAAELSTALTTQANPLLHQMFGYTPREDPAERLTRFEKRLYRSPNSAAAKQLTQHRKSNRADAAARKGDAFGQSEW